MLICVNEFIIPTTCGKQASLKAASACDGMSLFRKAAVRTVRGLKAGVLDDALGFPHADGNEDITEPQGLW